MKAIVKFSIPIFFCLLFVVSVFVANIKSPAISDLQQERKYIKVLFPERWFFFAINCKEPNLNFFRILENGKIKEIPINNGAAGSFFGFNRKFRLNYLLLYDLYKAIPDSSWTKGINGSLLNLDAITTISIPNSELKNFAKNDYLIYKKNKAPWIWSNNSGVLEVSKVLKVTIK
jgi:hypothetical protein